MPTNIKDVEPGSMVTFRSKNANDTVLWRGVVEMNRGTYKSIRNYTNPAAYNQAVRQTDPTVPSDETTLNYFLITVDNNSSNPTTLVFAQEWIEPGSLVVITPGNKVTLQVDDPNNNTNQIISILANAGYSVKIVS